MRKLNLEDSELKINIEELNSIIEKYNLSLPVTYQNFILENNGGYPELSNYGEPSEGGVSIEVFFSVLSEIGDPIETIDSLPNALEIIENNLFDNDFPNSLYPFGDGGGGTFLCISMNEENFGKIYKYFWDGSGLQYVCDSFEEFIEGLH